MVTAMSPVKGTEWFFYRDGEGSVKVSLSDSVKSQAIPIEAVSPRGAPRFTETLVESPQDSATGLWEANPAENEINDERSPSYYLSPGRRRSIEEKRLRREADDKAREENRPNPRCTDWHDDRHNPYRLMDEQLKEMTEVQLVKMSDEQLDALRPDQFELMPSWARRKLTLRRYMHLGHSEEYTKYLLQDYGILSPATPPDSPAAVMMDIRCRMEILRTQYPLSYKTLDEYRTLGDLEYSMSHGSNAKFDFIGEDGMAEMTDILDVSENGDEDYVRTTIDESGDPSTKKNAVAEAEQHAFAGAAGAGSVGGGRNNSPELEGDTLTETVEKDALTDEKDEDVQNVDDMSFEIGRTMIVGDEEGASESGENISASVGTNDQSEQNPEHESEPEPESNDKEVSEADDGWITEPEGGKASRPEAPLWSSWKKVRRNVRRRPCEFLLQVLLGYFFASFMWSILLLFLCKKRSSDPRHEGIMRARIISEDAMFFEGVVVASEPGTLADIEAGARRFLELILAA